MPSDVEEFLTTNQVEVTSTTNKNVLGYSCNSIQGMHFSQLSLLKIISFPLVANAINEDSYAVKVGQDFAYFGVL